MATAMPVLMRVRLSRLASSLIAARQTFLSQLHAFSSSSNSFYTCESALYYSLIFKNNSDYISNAFSLNIIWKIWKEKEIKIIISPLRNEHN